MSEQSSYDARTKFAADQPGMQLFRIDLQFHSYNDWENRTVDRAFPLGTSRATVMETLLREMKPRERESIRDITICYRESRPSVIRRGLGRTKGEAHDQDQD